LQVTDLPVELSYNSKEPFEIMPFLKMEFQALSNKAEEPNFLSLSGSE